MDPNDYLAAAELGLKPIHVASLDGDFEAVVKLACEACMIDAVTEPQTRAEWRLRETPIKLAALMGHLSIVEFLIEQGAVLAHDDGLHASSYARDEGLAEQRREFFLGIVKIGRENPDVVHTRKAIYDLLVSPGRRGVHNAMRGPRADLGFPDYKLAKRKRDIVVYAPVYRIKTDIVMDTSKTIGVIMVKGQGEVLMAAHSGFKLGGDRDENCLNTNEYNYIALHHIAAVLKFHFPGNQRDNGAQAVVNDEHRGRAHAGHVEVLLASWYALEMVRKSSGNPEAPLEWLLAHLHTLKHITLGTARSTIIVIDHQPCNTCLRFINRLFQYTGLHFDVKGGTGIGPTLVTKDKRGNIRRDTFADVFEDSDGEDSAPESPAEMAQDIIPETPNDVEENVPVIQATRQPFREPTTPPTSPPAPEEEIDDVSHAAALVRECIVPFTPARPTMQWPIPENRVRVPKVVEDPFRDIPSRRPENHHELIAEYKKKTPVWQWPGYEAIAYRPHIRPPRQPVTPTRPPVNPVPTELGGGNRAAGSPEDEDLILVDPEDDSDGATFSSPSSGSGGGIVQELTSGGTARIHIYNPGPAAQLLKANEPVFTHSSFAPIPRARDSESSGEKPQVDTSQVHGHGHGNNNSHNSDVPMRSIEDEDEDGYYMLRALTQQFRPLPANYLAGESSHQQQQQQQQQLDEETEIEEDFDNDDDDDDVDLVRQIAPRPAPQPQPGTMDFRQWRYQPQPKRQHQHQHQHQHGKGKATAYGAPTVQTPLFPSSDLPGLRRVRHPYFDERSAYFEYNSTVGSEQPWQED